MVKNKVLICRDYHIQPSEIDRMMYFEYEKVLEVILDIQKKEEEQRKKEEKQQQNMKMPNFNNMQNSLPKMPKI